MGAHLGEKRIIAYFCTPKTRIDKLIKMKTRRTLKDWAVALRPWSFSASAIPVLATMGYLFMLQGPGGEMMCDWVGAWLCLPVMMLLHSGGNLVSDSYDHTSGIDRPGGLNGVGWIDSGLFTAREIMHYGYWMLAVGTVLGGVVLMRGRMEVVWVGVLGVLLTLAYPWFKTHALGDVNILLTFALLPAIGVSYVATGSYHPESLLVSLPYGLLTVAILHANNTRDICNDRRVGIVTLPMLIGWRGASVKYVAEQFLPYLFVAGFVAIGGHRGLFAMAVTLAALPLALRNVGIMWRARPYVETDIATLDQLSAQHQLLFGLLYAAGFVAMHFIDWLAF